MSEESVDLLKSESAEESTTNVESAAHPDDLESANARPQKRVRRKAGAAPNGGQDAGAPNIESGRDASAPEGQDARAPNIESGQDAGALQGQDAPAPALSTLDEPVPKTTAREQKRTVGLIRRPPTEAMVQANRANSLKSTGPLTDVGKMKASLNAVKHGITSLASGLALRQLGEEPKENYII